MLRSDEERLLGAQIHDSLKWKTHILTGKKSLVKSLNSRVNALVKLCWNATFQTRLLAANGCFLSALSYLMPVWGGTEEYLLTALQVLHNRALRAVTKKSIYTPVKLMLDQCKWLSVRQMVFYYTVSLTWKIVKTGKPEYLASRLNMEFPRNTRQATQNNIRLPPQCNKRLTEKSFLQRAPMCFNQVPSDIRSIEAEGNFKHKLKMWIMEKIPLK